MAEYIEQEAGVELVEKLRYYANTYAIGDNLGREIEGTDELLFEAAEVIEKLIAADVAPVVRGRWVRHSVDGTDMFGEQPKLFLPVIVLFAGLTEDRKHPTDPTAWRRWRGK